MGLRVLAVCGALAPAVFTAAWAVSASLQPQYSLALEDLSALAARTATHPWLMIGGLVVSGLLIAAFSLALRSVLAGPGAAAGAYLVGATGFGTALLGLLRNDCSTLTEACKKRVEAGAVTWEHSAHDVLSVPVLACVALAPAVLALTFRADARFRRALWPYSLATAAVVSVLLALAGLEVPAGGQGAVQKAAVSAALAWLEVVAISLWVAARAAP